MFLRGALQRARHGVVALAVQTGDICPNSLSRVGSTPPPIQVEVLQ